MSLRTRGFSAVEVLIAVAIVGGLATSMMIISGNMSSTLQHDKYDVEADTLIQQIQDVLNQTGDPYRPPTDPSPNTNPQSPCDTALRLGGGPPGTPITFDFTQPPTTHTPIGFVQNANTVIAKVGQSLASGLLQVKSLYVRLPDPALGEGPAAESIVSRNGVLYETVNAKVVVEFQSSDQEGNRLLPRTADVVLMVAKDGTFQAPYCYTNQPLNSANRGCDAAHLSTGYPDCANSDLPPSRQGDINVTCFPTYKVVGFDNTQSPICGCQWSCSQPPKGTLHWHAYGWLPPSAVPGGTPPMCGVSGTWAKDGDPCRNKAQYCYYPQTIAAGNPNYGTEPAPPGTTAPNYCVSPNTTGYPGTHMCYTLHCTAP